MKWLICLILGHNIEVERGYHSGDMIEWEIHKCKRCEFYRAK